MHVHVEDAMHDQVALYSAADNIRYELTVSCIQQRGATDALSTLLSKGSSMH